MMGESLKQFTQLLARVAKGDEGALSDVLERICGPLISGAEKLIGKPLQPHLDATDVVQSVLMLLWQGLRSGKFQVTTPQQLLGLAKTLLRRTVARHWRSIKPITPATFEGQMSDTITDQPVSPSEWKGDPSRTCESGETVTSFLNQLDDVDRRLLQLRLAGHSTADAARHLGLDPGFLRVRLGRLRLRFQHLQA